MFSLYEYIWGPQNYYYLSLMKEKDEWTIHGLWPQYNTKNYPQFCRVVPFNKDAITDLLPKLNEYWCSDKGANTIFWEHEWNKHGTCMFNKCDEHDYFKKALDLYQMVKEKKLIFKYQTTQTRAMVPFTSKFAIMEPHQVHRK